MEIKVLGPGCKKCKSLEEVTRRAVAETGIDATITKVEDMMEMMKLGVLTTPALIVNGKILSKGKVLSVPEVVRLLEENKE